MAAPRFFLPAPPDCLTQGAVHPLDPDESRHAARVLRLREGAPVRFFNGKGLVGEAVIQDASPKETLLRIDSAEEIPPPHPQVSIAFPPPKGRRAGACVEALTELGADALLPLRTERSVAEGGDPDKWRARALEACKQCGRAWLPGVEPLADLPALLARAGEWDAIFLAAPEGTSPVAPAFHKRLIAAERILWLVGPEGGFTHEEEEAIRLAGAVPVCLSTQILRIATAATTALAITRASTLPDHASED